MSRFYQNTDLHKVRGYVVQCVYMEWEVEGGNLRQNAKALRQKCAISVFYLEEGGQEDYSRVTSLLVRIRSNKKSCHTGHMELLFNSTI